MFLVSFPPPWTTFSVLPQWSFTATCWTGKVSTLRRHCLPWASWGTGEVCSQVHEECSGAVSVWDPRVPSSRAWHELSDLPSPGDPHLCRTSPGSSPSPHGPESTSAEVHAGREVHGLSPASLSSLDSADCREKLIPIKLGISGGMKLAGCFLVIPQVM